MLLYRQGLPLLLCVEQGQLENIVLDMLQHLPPPLHLHLQIRGVEIPPRIGHQFLPAISNQDRLAGNDYGD